MHSMLRQVSCFIMVIVIVMLSLAGCSKGEHSKGVLKEADLSRESASTKDTQEEKGTAEEEKESEKEEPPADICVFVCGQVNHPGVYTLPAGSRLHQALDAAGGLTGAAAGEYLNQAVKVEDGEKIYVPSKEEAASELLASGNASATARTESNGSPEPDDGKVNINTAGAEELMQLTGIGKVKASSILSYRQEHGSFQSIEELKQVEGIKEGTYAKIEAQITTE